MCGQFDVINKKLSSIPDTTEDIVALQKYLEVLQGNELITLTIDKVRVAAELVAFTFDHTIFENEHILLVNTTFQWADKVKPVIVQAEERLTELFDGAVTRYEKWKKDFTERLEALGKRVKEFNHKDRLGEAQANVDELLDIGKLLDEYNKEKGQINKEELLLGNEETTPFNQIAQLQLRKEPYDKLWHAAVHFSKQLDSWMNGPMKSVDAGEVEDEIETLWKSIYKLIKIFSRPDTKAAFRAATQMKSKLEKFRIQMPLITAICNPGLKARHWEEINEKFGADVTPTETTTLSEMLQMNLDKILPELQEISSQASKEFALEKALSKMRQDWNTLSFVFVPYKDTGVSILSAVDDIQVMLDDHSVKTMTMKSSPFIGPFANEVNSWDEKLVRMKAIMDSWLRVQAAWLYLVPIFGSEDIRNQMPTEGKMFEEVDFYWRDIMNQSVVDPQALVVLSQANMLEKLKKSESMLDAIEKGLNDYLEKKRLFFPRFFFLSNDELLEILSETRDPLRVQPHLKKCFEGIAQLTFNEEKIATHMQSAEKEKVLFDVVIDPSQAHGLVEVWLQQVERVMKSSLQKLMKEAVESYQKTDRKDWVLQHPGQIVIAASTVHWTLEVTDAMAKPPDGLQEYTEKCTRQIDEIVAMVRGQRSKMERITLGALIVIDVHARDVVEQLTKAKILDPGDFAWSSQLRYYFIDGLIQVHMITTDVPYGYEYLGNSGRLVITPLTDRCYRTLLGALKLNLGGAPEGPAGTGKTETSKDLAKAVAKQCIVFNCSDGLDFKAMGKFFKGLAQSGAWACFDEFNRIDLEVLSVIAQQVQTIQRAIAAHLETFVFEGTTLTLDPSCTICKLF